MRSRWLRVVFAAACVMVPMSGAQAQVLGVDPPVSDLVQQISAQIAADPTLAGVTIQSADIGHTDLGRRELFVRVTLARPTQLQPVRAAVLSIMRANPAWNDWLAVNGLTVVSAGLTPPTSVCAVPSPAVVELLPPRDTDLHTLRNMVQDRIEVDPRLGGVLIAEIRRGGPSDASDYSLHVRGKLLEDSQREIVQSLFEFALAEHSAFAGATVAVDLNAMVVTPLSPRLGLRYYEMGLNAFWHCDYAVADEAFMRALAESPGSQVLLYWRVLASIAQHQLDRAELKLRPLVVANPPGSRSVIIAREFERIQGPLRWTLCKLENRILLNLVPELPGPLAPPPVPVPAPSAAATSPTVSLR